MPVSYLNEITDYIVAHIPEAAAAQRKKHKLQPTQRVTVDGMVSAAVFFCIVLGLKPRTVLAAEILSKTYSFRSTIMSLMLPLTTAAS